MANPQNPRLQSLTPLGHDQAEIATIGPVTIAETLTFALASLPSRKGREAEVAAIAATNSIPLPGPGKAGAAPIYGAIWLGPDQWMIQAPQTSHEDITAILKPIFGDAASITEQTDAWVRFDVTAPDLPRLFERLCNFDLHRHGPGSATRTVIDHLGCYIIHRAGNAVTILGPRSSAHALHHALITAARSAF